MRQRVWRSISGPFGIDEQNRGDDMTRVYARLSARTSAREISIESDAQVREWKDGFSVGQGWGGVGWSPWLLLDGRGEDQEAAEESPDKEG
jgi:hypothetical protein